MLLRITIFSKTLKGGGGASPCTALEEQGYIFVWRFLFRNKFLTKTLYISIKYYKLQFPNNINIAVSYSYQINIFSTQLK